MTIWNETLNSWYGYLSILPNLLFALVVLLIGWLLSALLARGVRRLLDKTTLDNRLFEQVRIDPTYRPEVLISRVVYFVLLFFVIILFFNILNLQMVSQPIVAMLTSIAQAVPYILKAGLILLLGWITASLLSFLTLRAGQTVRFDRLISKWNLVETEEEGKEALQKASRFTFYLILLIFLPGVFGALNIAAISEPLSAMLTQTLHFLPNLFGALLTLLIGWLVAKIVRQILTNFLSSVGTDRLAERVGLDNVFTKTSLSQSLGTIAFVLILIPTAITALQTLNLTGISEPAISMLNAVLVMIPKILVAILFILIGLWLGHTFGRFVSGILEKIGFSSLFEWMGLNHWNRSARVTPSLIGGRIVQVLVILLFTVEALSIMQLQILVDLSMAVIAYLPNLFVALLFLGLGLFLGNFVQRLLLSLHTQSLLPLPLLAGFAKYAIYIVSLFMALDQMGVANSIVNAAFILMLGGLSLAFGLSFGLGGREFAASWLRKWQNQWQWEQKVEDKTPGTDSPQP